MRVLVTGAAGRMGAHLTRRLVTEGHEVRAFVLPGDPNNQAIDGPGVEIVSGRLEDVAAVEAAVDGVDAIAALAGALTSRLASDRQFYEVNIGGTFNLLMAARAQMPRIQRFVYASSDAVYWSGWHTPPLFLPVDETHPRIPGSIYGATKVSAEELSLQFRRTYGVPSVVIRPTATADTWELIEPDSVFGRRIFLQGCIRFLSGLANRSADDDELLETLRAHDDGAEQLFVLADEQGQVPATNLADARDLAQGLHLALTRPEAIGETFNIGPAAPYGEDELVRHIGAALGLRVVVIPRPHVRASWYVSSVKARGILGYRPQHTVFSMVDEAVAAKRIGAPGADHSTAG
ncbi:MAG: NAD(P)-dependent oxidoreductase [Chloroflexi bacterium]|nr:NAD(P)-dependent oxidoreductase [Chloroflexota bacterium]